MYSSKSINSYKHTGEYLYDKTDDTSKSAPARANMQIIKSFSFSSSVPNGKETFTFTAPDDFKVLYSDKGLSEEQIMKYLGIRIQPSGCSNATLTIDDIVIIECGGAISFETGVGSKLDSIHDRVEGEIIPVAALPIPTTTSSYDFEAWYFDPQFTQKVVEVIVPKSGEEIVLYAKWIKGKRKI